MIAVVIVFIASMLVDELCEWVMWHFGKDGEHDD